MQNQPEKEFFGGNEWHDPVIFEQFFRAHHAQMVMFAQRFVDDRETARDIVQEVFLKTWENKEKIDIDTSLRSYLLTAIRNQCSNFIKHRDITQKYSNEIQAELKELEVNYYASVEEQHLSLFEKETGERIQRTIRNLPEKCRRIFELSRFDGLKSSEIAQQMNISVRTVETQIYRALKTLKIFIGQMKKNDLL